MSEANGHPLKDSHTENCCGDTCSKECACGTCPPMPPNDEDFDGEKTVPGPEAMTLILEKVRVALSMHVSPAVLSSSIMEQRLDPISKAIIAHFELWLWSNMIHVERRFEDFPKTWWDGFKEAHFPGFLKRRFPVRLRSVCSEAKTFHICPHLNIQTRDDEKYHLQFMTPAGEMTRLNR